MNIGKLSHLTRSISFIHTLRRTPFNNKFPFSSKPQKQKIPKLTLYAKLCRYDKPIGAMLLFWPTAWGVCLGSTGLPSLYYLGLFFMGSWTARSAGCIVNDYFDRDFDKKVERTKTRPLATGQVSKKQALALLFGNLAGGVIVLFHLPLNMVLFTMGVVGLAGVYPLTKRITNYPQLVLGIAFNTGVIIGSLSLNPELALGLVIPLYISGISWTMIYDTIYAYQDIKDDILIGIKSTAIHWKNKDPKKIMEGCLYVSLLCHLGMGIADPEKIWSVICMVGADIYLLQILRKLNIEDRKECGEFFLKNNRYGMLIFLSLLLTNVIDWGKKKIIKEDPDS